MSETAELYQTLVKERACAPRFAVPPLHFDAEAAGDNPLCGDHVHVWVHGGAVAHASRGCAIMTASADLMAEAVAGLNPRRIAALRTAFETMVTSGQANTALGALNALAGVAAYRSRIRCATLPWQTLAQALERFHGEQNGK